VEIVLEEVVRYVLILERGDLVAELRVDVEFNLVPSYLSLVERVDHLEAVQAILHLVQ